MRLNALTDRPGATKAKKRLGRGIGSGLGKTSGRGHKGQKSRSGVALKGFEGGQMPLDRRLPKRGFKNIFSNEFNEINLGRIQQAVGSGRLDGNKTITVAALKEAGLIRREKDGVRLLGMGELKAKLSFEVTGASQSAIKAIEAKGGTVTFKSITGREKPAADKIKAERRAAKRAAESAQKSGKGKTKAEPAQKAEAKSAKEEAPAKSKSDEGGNETPSAKPAEKDSSE
jgi:large subunit ribosomal protein L15